MSSRRIAVPEAAISQPDISVTELEQSSHRQDLQTILSHRSANGGDYWATPDGRWGVGAPFSTFECGLMLFELGLKQNSLISRGIADILFGSWEADGRIRPGPGLPVQPCHTASAARLLCRLGFAADVRLKRTFEWLLANRHTDAGWRCNRVKLGDGADTDASNPGVTLAVLDAFRFDRALRKSAQLDGAIDTLLAHWSIRRPMGPCGFGIGSRFMQIEFPFARYNLFSYVYVLSFYDRARPSPAFGDALRQLKTKLVAGTVIVEHTRPGLDELGFCRQGAASSLATRRYREIVKNLGR